MSRPEDTPVQEEQSRSMEEASADYLPAPNRIEFRAPLRWVRLGWKDFRRAPWQSLVFGLLVVIVGYLITGLALLADNLLALFILLGGFLLVAPLVAFALYDTSRQLEMGRTPAVRHCWQAMRANLGNQLIFAVVLLVIMLVWARAAALVHVFFPAMASPHWQDLALFFAVGTAVGALFAAFVFGVSAFSLPMMMDRGADVISACITSLRAVASNKPAMVLWAALIVGAVLIGFVTAYLALAVTLPVIGYATWHGYREAIPRRAGDS